MFQKIVNKLNDLRPKQLFMLAVVAAVLMFMTIYAGMSLLVKEEVVVQPEEKTEPPPIEKTAVVVAKVNIPPRTRIQETMLQMKELPEDLVPEGAIKDFDDVLNVQVKVSVFAGDVLTIQKVFADKSAEGFVGTIPTGCRAISISVNEITGVAGFAKPGDFVDLLLVERSEYSATTNLLLQNILLLSVNQDMGDSMVDTSGVTNQAISNPTIATFALYPDEVMKLIAASKLGEIYMSLRPADSQSNYSGTVEYTIESINAPPKPEPVQPAQDTPVIPENPTPVMPLPQLPAAPATPKIEIIQGDEIVQSAEEEPLVVTPSKPQSKTPSKTNPPLPVIPSRPSNQSSTKNPFENSPASQALDSLPFSNSRAIKGGN